MALLLALVVLVAFWLVLASVDNLAGPWLLAGLALVSLFLVWVSWTGKPR
jgi:hypothetical protein